MLSPPLRFSILAALLAALAVAAPAQAKEGDGVCIWLKLDPAVAKDLAAREPTMDILRAHQDALGAASRACGISSINAQLVGDLIRTQYHADRLLAADIDPGAVRDKWEVIPPADKSRFDALVSAPTSPSAADEAFSTTTLEYLARAGHSGETPDKAGLQAVWNWLGAVIELQKDEKR